MQQVVPNAIRIDTASFPLCVPDEVRDQEDDEVFKFLVVAWVFTAWLQKKFPKADITDCAMLAGLAAWKPVKQLIPLMKVANKRFPNHPKAKQNLAMLKCIDNDFTLKKEATKEEFAELKALNDQAIKEVDALFPCVCGECPEPPKSN